MRYYTKAEFMTTIESILECLGKEEEIIITDEGNPIALLIDVSEDNLEEVINVIHQNKTKNC